MSAIDRGCAPGPTGGLRAVWHMLKNVLKRAVFRRDSFILGTDDYYSYT